MRLPLPRVSAGRKTLAKRVFVIVTILCVFSLVIGYLELVTAWKPFRQGFGIFNSGSSTVYCTPLPPSNQAQASDKGAPPKDPNPAAQPAAPPPPAKTAVPPAPPSRVPRSLAYVIHNVVERDEILDWTLSKFASFLPSWPIQVFVDKRVEQQVRRLPTVTKLLAENRLCIALVPVRDGYRYPWESMLLDEELWKNVQGEKVLVFEPSSAICEHPTKRLEDFMQYDFVGAVLGDWNNPNRFASGWTSLRTTSKMLEILKKFPVNWSVITREDGYFRAHIDKVGGRAAPEHENRLFASGREMTPGSLFWSGAGVFLGRMSPQMRQACPAVEVYVRRQVAAPPGPRPAKAPPSYDEFIAASKRIPARQGAPKYDLGILIIHMSPVPLGQLEMIMKNAMANVDLGKWKIQIAAGPALLASLRTTEPFKRLIAEGAVATLDLRSNGGPHPHAYNKLLFSRWFWEEIVFEKFALVHVDSVMCGHSPYKLEDFIPLDYAGAQWEHFPFGLQVGNGGSSWRSRSKHLAVIDKFKPLEHYRHQGESQNEDLVYSDLIPKVGGIVADVHSAGNYGCEMIQNLHCLFLHSPHKYNFGQERELRAFCPEAIPWLGSRGA